ncbi:carboxypeptidase-like regulatory domain-containing protein [Pedobacter sp. CG_S7]|uniref:carboxypeptidase-like regulatory domain-containing protein n=1 Tax=Pedobacter sp. CG_S7 TaxID=3143930 RepID=UPI0033977882
MLFFLYASYLAKGQGFNIRGQLSGGIGGDVGYATVTLRSITDTQLICGASADSVGRFVLSGLNSGTYTLHIQSIGMEPFKQQLELKNGDLEPPLIQMRVDSKHIALSEVTITSQKPFLKREIDKLVVDIASSVYSRGENAMRLFNVIPGVQTDAFGNILYRGTEAVTVYIDNIKVQLSGQQLANYLRSIPSESIKSYEIRSIGGGTV